MPITLPAAMQTASEAPQQAQPWIWLWDIEIQRRNAVLPSVVLRMCSATEEIEWPPAATAPPRLTWYPLQFSHSAIESSREADLPAIDLAIDNTARTLMRFLHSGDGFEGNRATLYLVHESALASPAHPNHEFQQWDFVIAQAQATETQVQLRLEQPNFFQIRVPFARFLATRCRWKFGGSECGYPITPVAAFTTCDKSVAACIARGDDEVARRLPRLHPKRYGGFPGIPVQRGT